MTLQTVSLSQLVPSKANPRKAFDAAGIEGLAASIRTDGVLQNLVVSPLDGKGKRFAIISGERRYRAIKLLEQRGELPDGFAVPVKVREELSAEEKLRLATVENLQRANLAPLEETAALAKLVRNGETLDDVAAQTGLSPTTIKRRLALGSLCKQAAAALRKGAITLAQAEALTLGATDAQKRLLDEIISGRGEYTAAMIRDTLLDERPAVALAIFPLAQYTGTITTDLFAEAQGSYFDDAEQFFSLQRQAAEALAAKHRETAAWVELTEHYRVPEWQYDKAEDGEASGVLINLSPSGKVEVLEGLMRHGMDADTAAETAENPMAPAKPKASYGLPLRRYIAYRKSAAVQEVLLGNPRKAKEVAAVQALATLRIHDCLRELTAQAETSGSCLAIEELSRRVLDMLGFEVDDDAFCCIRFRFVGMQDTALYEAVKALTDAQLDELHTLLTALSFGQQGCDMLDTGDSLFNRVARDLNVDMTQHWYSDHAFLDRRSREQLLVIARECGVADTYTIAQLRSYKKAELVAVLLRHVDLAQAADEPTPAQLKALRWLPGVMQFPAIDPDAPAPCKDDEMLEE